MNVRGGRPVIGQVVGGCLHVYFLRLDAGPESQRLRDKLKQGLTSGLRSSLAFLARLRRLVTRRFRLRLLGLPAHAVERHRCPGVVRAFRTEPLPVGDGVQRRIETLEVIRVVALSTGAIRASDSDTSDRGESVGTRLVALERGVVVAGVLVADDADVRRVDVQGMTREVGELVVRAREDERGVLPRGDSAGIASEAWSARMNALCSSEAK